MRITFISIFMILTLPLTSFAQTGSTAPVSSHPPVSSNTDAANRPHYSIEEATAKWQAGSADRNAKHKEVYNKMLDAEMKNLKRIEDALQKGGLSQTAKENFKKLIKSRLELFALKIMQAQENITFQQDQLKFAQELTAKYNALSSKVDSAVTVAPSSVARPNAQNAAGPAGN